MQQNQGFSTRRAEKIATAAETAALWLSRTPRSPIPLELFTPQLFSPPRFALKRPQVNRTRKPKHLVDLHARSIALQPTVIFDHRLALAPPCRMLGQVMRQTNVINPRSADGTPSRRQ